MSATCPQALQTTADHLAPLFKRHVGCAPIFLPEVGLSQVDITLFHGQQTGGLSPSECVFAGIGIGAVRIPERPYPEAPGMRVRTGWFGWLRS